MPTISIFYGIVIAMYFRDVQRHHLPHIHARYQNANAVFSIEDGSLLDGEFPPNKTRLVQAWIEFTVKTCRPIGRWPSTVKSRCVFHHCNEDEIMLLDVVKVTPTDHRWLLLDFQNGEKRCFDMLPLLDQKPWIRIKSAALFQRAFVENGTVAWPGNIDIAPETLYDLSVPLQP